MNSTEQGRLEGTWVPVAASVAGTGLDVQELRVRYLLLEASRYRIVDRSNQVVDGGEYRVNNDSTPAALDLVGRTGPGAGRTLRAIFELEGDELTVCYDLEGGERPAHLQSEKSQLLLRIRYTRVAIGFS